MCARTLKRTLVNSPLQCIISRYFSETKPKLFIFSQLQKVMNKSRDPNSLEEEREKSLVEQWVSLTEEQNAVQLPPPGSNIPGAPADWNPPIGKEAHIPVVFLNLNGKNLF